MEIQRSALRKLKILHAVESLADLAAIPGNRLEKLRGDRLGRYSLRINRQWRLCFLFEPEGAYEVEITDYHS